MNNNNEPNPFTFNAMSIELDKLEGNNANANHGGASFNIDNIEVDEESLPDGAFEALDYLNWNRGQAEKEQEKEVETKKPKTKGIGKRPKGIETKKIIIDGKPIRVIRRTPRER